MKSSALIRKITLLVLAFAASAHAAGSQTSAHYNFTAESIDGGGLRSASADYKSDGSFSPGGFVLSADYTQRGGYAGQLNNAPVATNYSLTIASNSTIKIPISVLLSTARDADGDSISFVGVASASAQNGEVGRNGIWLLYKPPAGFVGGDSITWLMQDSEGDQNNGTILAQVTVPPTAPDQPTLNLISITFDTAPNATDATLHFAGLPQATYLVQYTGSLAPPVAWTTLGTVAVTNGIFQIVDPTAGSASQRYYRAVYQSP
jgi:hypothetical protein